MLEKFRAIFNDFSKHPQILSGELLGGSRPVATPHVPPPTGGMPGLRKIDIQSKVLIWQFSANFGPRNGWEMAICPTKKIDFLAHFEAPELSYPILTFLCNFWNLKDLEMSVPGTPIFQISRFDF